MDFQPDSRPDLQQRSQRDSETRAHSPASPPNVIERDALGRVQEGNRLAVRHALHAIDLPPELRHLREEIAVFEAACAVDEGDADDMPVRRRSMLTYRARLHRRVLQIDDAIELHGLTDARGKLRVAWLGKLESLIAAAVRIDNLLGLERRSKRVPSLAELVNEGADV